MRNGLALQSLLVNSLVDESNYGHLKKKSIKLFNKATFDSNIFSSLITFDSFISM